MGRLILVEGIPGSGKTSSLKFIYNRLLDNGYKVKKYEEGELHPCDLAWHGVIPKEEFEEILKRFPEYKEVLETRSIIENDKVIVAYTKLDVPPSNPLVKVLETYLKYIKEEYPYRISKVNTLNVGKNLLIQLKVYIFLNVPIFKIIFQN